MSTITKRISYATLAEKMNPLLCNNVTNVDENLYENLQNGEYEYCYKHEDGEHGDGDDCEYEQYDIYQMYLISEWDADYLKRHTNEIVFYSDELDLYVWGVTHFGTMWSGVYLDYKEEDYS